MYETNADYPHAPSYKNEGIGRRAIMAGAAAFAVGGLLGGCAGEAVEKPGITASSAPFPRETAAPTPTPRETTPPPEEVAVVEKMGINGEYFGAVPTWEQDFSQILEGPLAPHDWNILVGPGPGNSEEQYYTNSISNVRVENDHLVLQAHAESVNGYDYTSGRIETLGKADFMYGKFEVEAKLPSGVGTWPAVWLLPSESVYLHQNPGIGLDYLADGEMDIIEAIGSEQNNVYGIAHSLVRPDNPEYEKNYYATKVVPDADTAFHTYGLEWTPTNLTFLIDDEKYYSVTKRDYYDFHQWPYDQKYHLIMNLAMGGNWAGQQTDLYPGDGIDKSALPATFEIASVKYFPYVATPEG